MNKYLAEFIGAFVLVLTIGCAVLGGGPGVIPPLAIGAALMVMVFAGGYVSGVHYTPAVTVAVYRRGKCAAKNLVPYIVARVAAAIVAAWVVEFMAIGPAESDSSRNY
jgi:aquaporin Z